MNLYNMVLKSGDASKPHSKRNVGNALVHIEHYRSFFLSKNVLRCHSCRPATDKQTKSDRKLKVAIFEFVDRFNACICSSLQMPRHKELTKGHRKKYSGVSFSTFHVDKTSPRELMSHCRTISSAQVP